MCLLLQKAGLTVVAEKLNYYRYLSHFRCVHRGAYFASMRTTSVRRLLPEAWGMSVWCMHCAETVKVLLVVCLGFLCPVHTPDGAPCGLLNHLSANAQVVC